MKKISLSILALLSAMPAMAQAATSDMMVAATMQRCSTNEECALVSNSCQDNCGFVPVNKANLPTLDTLYQSRCGKPMAANPTCTVNPPMNAACVNSRCTIDTAYKQVASAGDYKSGAYPVPEAAVPSKVQANIQDSKSLTAYQLPQTDVKQNTVGTITTKVYVPPSAPVSGSNYIPVGQAPAAAAPVAVAPAPTAIPPQAVPTQQTHATPPELVPPVAPRAQAPALPPVAAAPAVPATPQQLPPVAATPTVPPMTPSIEPSAAVAPPAPTYVAPAPAMPQATAPIPSIGATGVPQAPAGAKPIPPSDLQPVPTFVPPAGTASPVSAEDPGAPPPADTTLIMSPAPDGSKGMTMVPSLKGKPAVKSFSAGNTTAAKKTTATDSFN